MSELFLRSIPSLLLLGALAGGWWWLRHRPVGSRPGPQMRVVGRAGLLRNATVAMIEVDGIRFLVGATEQRVELLTELGEAPVGTEVDPVFAQDSELTSGPWMDLLARARSARSWRPSEGPESAAS